MGKKPALQRRITGRVERRRAGLDQWLPLYLPFRASWQMASRSCRRFLHPLGSFRTAGFPQYGWKPAWSSCALPEPSPASFGAGPFLSGFGGSEIRPSLASEEETISGRQSSLHVAACTFARAAGQSLPAAPATDSPARLQQSLPQSGSPPTKVCYDYSAQPSIAEAGLAPASMSKTEGCT